ncbi:hypothetical protein C1752_01664 [Acaryochloris thomasi RCC1774]|uniref:Uncharacterized protein n=1 Tax=Acaryochloris thomasi RCC1774 TaxID=1764569 RepID=A0A2W1JKX3_9CYAN|nr:hypothetical protein [Acaryochloris thomasi]PZD74053.1 hypothetical protein C1752_01664 [Acaryochloris thomasi RCC1774]
MQEDIDAIETGDQGASLESQNNEAANRPFQKAEWIVPSSQRSNPQQFDSLSFDEQWYSLFP